MVDIAKLKEDLINYFGVFSQFDDKFYVTIAEIQSASDEKIISMARQYGFKIENYVVGEKRGR
jgi:hypothetical protein